MKAIFITTLLLSFLVSNAQQPGTLDKSFGTGGITVTDFGDKTSPDIYKAVLQSDNKIIDGGHYSSANAKEPFGPFAVRYTAGGILDSSYGDKGKAVIQIPFENYTDMTGIAILKDDRLLLSGSGYHNELNPIYDGYILRLKTNGSLDSSFGKNGFAKLNVNGYGEYGDLTVQNDGKIIVLGADGNSGFISRLSENGTVDETFGDKGYVHTNNSYGFFSCKIQRDGKIVVAGYDDKFGFTNRRFCLQRYLPDGTIDKSFGDGGTVITPYGDDAWIHEIGLQLDGKIVAGGEVTYYSPYNTFFAAARYNADGSPDATFGTEGKTTSTFGDSLCIAMSLAVQQDDKIILGGYRQLNRLSNFAMIRLTSDGVPDSSFGGYGKAFTDFDSATSINSVLLQTTGKIIAAGPKGLITHNGCTVSRYNNDIGKRQMIAIKVKRWLQHRGITWVADKGVRYYTVQKSRDGGATYQPVVRLYNNHQSLLTYEDAVATENTTYRVAVVAKDGSRSFSNAVAIGNEEAVKVFPNPVHNTLQLQGLPANTKTNITITDFNGTVRTSATASGGSVSINTAALKPGNYLLTVQSKHTTTTQAFVKE